MRPSFRGCAQNISQITYPIHIHLVLLLKTESWGLVFYIQPLRKFSKLFRYPCSNTEGLRASSPSRHVSNPDSSTNLPTAVYARPLMSKWISCRCHRRLTSANVFPAFCAHRHVIRCTTSKWDETTGVTALSNCSPARIGFDFEATQYWNSILTCEGVKRIPNSCTIVQLINTRILLGTLPSCTTSSTYSTSDKFLFEHVSMSLLTWG